MVKLLEVIGRRADWTHEDFIRYQITNHLAAVERVPEFLRPVRRYMQNHLYIRAEELAPISGLPIATSTDSIIEVWYDDVDAIRRAFQEPRYYEILRPDELAFGDVAGAWGVATTDSIVIDRPGFGGLVKLFVFLKRRAGASHDDFLARWATARDRWLTSERVGRLVENRVGQDPADRLPGMRDYDLVAELWFESIADVAALAAEPGAAAALTGDGFADPASTLIYLGREKPEAAAWLARAQAAL